MRDGGVFVPVIGTPASQAVASPREAVLPREGVAPINSRRSAGGVGCPNMSSIGGVGSRQWIWDAMCPSDYRAQTCFGGGVD